MGRGWVASDNGNGVAGLYTTSPPVSTLQKHCCDSNKCNRQPFYPDDDAATRAPLAGSLFAAILFSIWLNFRL